MMDHAWISDAIGLILVVLAIPTFIREVREMRTGGLTSGVSKRGVSLTAVIMGLLVLLSWGAVAFDFYDRRNHRVVDIPAIQEFWQHFTDYREEHQKPYTHETVILDGLRCRGCRFNDVTFVWNGTAPFDLLDTTFVAPKGTINLRFQSSNPIVSGTIALMRDIGGLLPGVELQTQPWSPQSR
jgi:hypothetical protein